MAFGFLALLVVLVVLALNSIHALKQLEISGAVVRQNYLAHERTLRNIRGGLEESESLLGEYALTHPSTGTRGSYLEQLHDLRDHVNAAMESALRQASSQQQELLRRLSVELEKYWLTANHTMSAGELINHKVSHQQAVAQRVAVIAITREVSGVNELELQMAEQEISDDFGRTRQRLQNATLFAVAISLLLATSTILYVSRLENRAENKYIESLRYQRQLKELSKRLVDVQELERRAISRELHDQIAQSLTALLMDVQELTDTSPTFDSSANRLKKIREVAEDCVKKVRNMALLLRPSMLDDLGLIAALEWQGREVSKRTGLVVEIIDHNFNDDLSEEDKTCIYRVVQESLHNCATHANASRVRVLLEEDRQHLVLSIDDDGVGFDPQRKRGMGLLGMRERVACLDGTFLVDSVPGKGTVIRVELALARSRQREGHQS
jgi:signal transduction histidine kinase